MPQGRYVESRSEYKYHTETFLSIENWSPLSELYRLLNTVRDKQMAVVQSQRQSTHTPFHNENVLMAS